MFLVSHVSFLAFVSDWSIASTLSVFRPGSISPSAMLYDAWESFSQRSANAEESIRSSHRSE
jgi:hypothetical protein